MWKFIAGTTGVVAFTLALAGLAPTLRADGPKAKRLPPEAAKLLFCTETAHAVRDAYVEQLSKDGKCMTGAFPAPITSRLCEVARVFRAPTNGKLVEVGIQPVLDCLTCADDEKVEACGQEAAIGFALDLGASGSYLTARAAVAVTVDLLADATYIDRDTDVARIEPTAGTGADGGFNLVKGIISPEMTYTSGTTLNVAGSVDNPALSAAFAVNVTQSCNVKGRPEAFIVPIGLPELACPIEVVPEPVGLFLDGPTPVEDGEGEGEGDGESDGN